MEHNLEQIARRAHAASLAVRQRVLLEHSAQNAGLTCVAKDLTLPQMSTLAVIRDREQMTIKEIAEATKVSAPSASAMVDRLVDIGVCIRRPSTVDRREVQVSLSPDGMQAVEAMEGQILRSLLGLLEELGPEYARQWDEVNQRILSLLKTSCETTNLTALENGAGTGRFAR